MSEINADSGSTQATTDTDTTTGTEATTPAEGLPGGEGESAGDESTDTEGETGPESEEEGGEEQKGAPEKYESFDVTKGKDIGYTISEDQHEKLSAFGKENNLNQAAMNAMIDYHIEKEKAATAENENFVTDYKTAGIKASRKEHGEKYSNMHAKNMLTFEKYFPEAGRKALNDMGISSQDWFFNALNAITASISEDVTVPGDGAGNSKKNRTLAQAMSPKT